MRINKRLVASLSLTLLLPTLPTATAEDVEFVVAELGGVSVVSIPQPSPLPGLLATKVVLRARPESQLVTFENVKITGAAHQVWTPSACFGFSPTSTPFVDARCWDIFPPEWIAADSHILISPSMVGGGGTGIVSIKESNDLTNPAMANENLPLLEGQATAITGMGDTAMKLVTDVFFVTPEFQLNEIDFAYLVTPDDSTGAAGEVFLTVGVLGDGFINSGDPGGASFGFRGNDPGCDSFHSRTVREF